MRWVCLIGSLALGVVSSAVAHDCDLVVYYIPLELKLYQPATPEYIRENGKRLEGRLDAVCALLSSIDRSSRRVAENEDLSGYRIMVVDRDSDETYFLTKHRSLVREGEVYDVQPHLLGLAINEVELRLEE